MDREISWDCDAAFAKALNIAGIVAVARDHKGRVIDGVGVRKSTGSSLVAEAEAIRSSQLMAKQRG